MPPFRKLPNQHHGIAGRISTDEVPRFQPPTKHHTHGYDLSLDVIEFIQAISRFKAESGRQALTYTEILGVARKLGYAKSLRGG